MTNVSISDHLIFSISLINPLSLYLVLMPSEEKKYESLIENISEVVHISADDARSTMSAFKVKILDKKEILLQKGDVSNHMRFIVNGCLRSYYRDENAQEYIVQFGVKGWWVNDLYSYLTESPAACFIQALQPSMLLQIHRDSLNKLYDEIPLMERFFRIKFQNAYVALQERNLSSMSLSAKERYENFRRQYRNIEQSVPQYMIASYLGITPEFLSSIRNIKS